MIPVMSDRERFLALMGYKPVDRCVYGVWASCWPETRQRWQAQGWDPAAPSPFTVDAWNIQDGWFFPNPPFERRVIEEDGSGILVINSEGILMRERRDNPMSSMPQFVKFPVESRREFRSFFCERMQPDAAARIGADYVMRLQGLRPRDTPLLVIADRWGGFFGGLRAMLGIERLCTLFYDDPVLVEEMMDGIADFLVSLMGRILDHTSIDIFGFWEDMACKTGPLVGPDLFRRFAFPRYRRVVDFLRSRGVPHVCLDSDGNVTSLIPIWMDAGIDTLYPFEAQAGMDVVAVRRRYGRNLRLWFGIDKRALCRGPSAIEDELARVRPLIEEGGYVPGLDHGIPPDVPFEAYLFYMRKLGEACGVPPALRGELP